MGPTQAGDSLEYLGRKGPQGIRACSRYLYRPYSYKMGITRLGVVGSGTMGVGIAEVGLLGGWEVVVVDTEVAALDRAEVDAGPVAGQGRRGRPARR